MRRQLPGAGRTLTTKAVLLCAFAMLYGLPSEPVRAQPKPQTGASIKQAAVQSASLEGKSTFQAMCSTCHESGALGAPMITDKAAWQSRIAQGTQMLYSSALNGIGNMPAKGGHPQLSDDQVKAAVDYIVSTVSGGAGGKQQTTKAPTGGSQQASKSSGSASGGGVQASGQQTFAQVCSNCHQNGTMGAPKFGSQADWAPRIKQGKTTLYSHAINGYNAMPPKGGQPSLSDSQVKAAVDYMVAEVSGGGGGSAQQQTAKGSGAASQGASSAAAEKKAPAQSQPSVQAGKLKADTCMGCHGIPGYTAVYPTYHVPMLGGQHAEYIVSALQEYKTGGRKQSTMHAQAMALSDKDMQDIAAYFESLAPEAPAGGGGGQQQAAKSGGGNNQVAAGIKQAAAQGASPAGKSTFQAMCSTCHVSGALGAPMITDKTAWQSRVAQGPKVLYSSAINGIGAMPAKGGHPQLSDGQVKAAVDYIISRISGGKAAQGAQPKAQTGASIKQAAAQGASREGKSTFEAVCSTCHSSGALGAPMITDKAAWKSRIAQGTQVLYSSALNGIGNMPAKGGHPELSDDQVKVAVDYIVSQVAAKTGQTAAAKKSQSDKAKQGQ